MAQRDSFDPEGPWSRLTLAISYATEAHLFIKDLNQSPFNVGKRVPLEDFTIEQVAELNRRRGSPLRGEEDLGRFFGLIGGHPYLTNRGLYEMARQRLDMASFEAMVSQEEGLFGDHLRRIVVNLGQDPDLRDVVAGVLRGRPCPTSESFYRLRAAGVLAGASARHARPRCPLYETYLMRNLR